MIEVQASPQNTYFPTQRWGYSKFAFSGGEIQVRMDPIAAAPFITSITAHLRAPNDIIEMLLVTNAIQHASPNTMIELKCPYLPYGRQDRVCAAGEAFALEVMANLLNTQNYLRVEVWDAHSKVSQEKVQRCANVPAADLMPAHITDGATIVAPDMGGRTRAQQCADVFRRPIIYASKVRNPANGEITGTTVDSDYVGARDFLIVDDICDGGRTFIELAKVLRPLTTGKIKLWVTHGIFSKGFEVFNGFIDEIYTANCFVSDSTLPAFVHVGHLHLHA